jgi:hypothetical protein
MPKQSSSKLSTLAARYLKGGRTMILEMMHDNRMQLIDDVLALAGSVVSQDETKGQGMSKSRPDPSPPGRG